LSAGPWRGARHPGGRWRDGAGAVNASSSAKTPVVIDDTTQIGQWQAIDTKAT
jgi:hypothetical protein